MLYSRRTQSVQSTLLLLRLFGRRRLPLRFGLFRWKIGFMALFFIPWLFQDGFRFLGEVPAIGGFVPLSDINVNPFFVVVEGVPPLPYN
jgi:hypothetical protein